MTMPNFPKKNTRFKLQDFFQTEVDEFHDGEFLFLSAKEKYVKTDRYLQDKTKNVDNKGWVISTYCYTNKSYHKILVCKYKPMPWENHYHIETQLAGVNGCDGYSVNDTIEEFISWMKPLS